MLTCLDKSFIFVDSLNNLEVAFPSLSNRMRCTSCFLRIVCWRLAHLNHGGGIPSIREYRIWWCAPHWSEKFLVSLTSLSRMWRWYLHRFRINGCAWHFIEETDRGPPTSMKSLQVASQSLSERMSCTRAILRSWGWPSRVNWGIGRGIAIRFR